MADPESPKNLSEWLAPIGAKPSWLQSAHHLMLSLIIQFE